MIRGVIFALDIETGIWKLEQTIGEYSRCGIFPSVRESKHRVQFQNGDTWRVIAIHSGNTIGVRANICYIDARIKETVVRQVIQPCLSLHPYTGVRYFFPPAFDEEEEDNELSNYFTTIT